MTRLTKMVLGCMLAAVGAASILADDTGPTTPVPLAPLTIDNVIMPIDYLLTGADPLAIAVSSFQPSAADYLAFKYNNNAFTRPVISGTVYKQNIYGTTGTPPKPNATPLYPSVYEGTKFDGTDLSYMAFSGNLRNCSFIKTTGIPPTSVTVGVGNHDYSDWTMADTIAAFTPGTTVNNVAVTSSLNGAIFMGNTTVNNVVGSLAATGAKDFVFMVSGLADAVTQRVRAASGYTAVTNLTELADRLDELTNSAAVTARGVLRDKQFRLAADHLINMPDLQAKLKVDVTSDLFTRLVNSTAGYDTRFPFVAQALGLASIVAPVVPPSMASQHAKPRS